MGLKLPNTPLATLFPLSTKLSPYFFPFECSTTRFVHECVVQTKRERGGVGTEKASNRDFHPLNIG